jgi:REP element-mobilizing transposase RayT
MGKTLGYMVTFTTYGTWLQGDKRGWVKNANIYQVNPCIEEANKEQMQHTAVRLSKIERDLVREAMLGKARERKQKVYAISVWSNHVHIVFENDGWPISKVVQAYKNAATVALKKNGFCGKVWTSGYDKRYCFDEKALRKRIEYVERHTKTGTVTPEVKDFGNI